MYTDEFLKKILEACQTIAVCGMSRHTEKAARYVPAYLREQGYRIIPINPHVDEIDGLTCYPTVHEVPDRIDMLNVFRPSKQALEVVKQAVARHRERGDIKVIWLQLGIKNDEARQLAEAAGITFVQNKCTLAEHKSLF